MLLEEAFGNSLADAVTYGTTILACEKGGQWQSALQIFNALSNDLKDGFIYTTVMGACTQARQWESALWLFAEMQQLSLRTGVVSYTAAIDAFGCASQWQKAVFLLAQLQSMPNDFPNLMTYTAVAAATRSCFAAGFFP